MARGRLPPALLALVLAGAGCTIRTGHTIAPYGRDAPAAHRLEDEAIRECRERRGGAQPPASFTTDGCSWWLDGDWVECCVTHDRAYWCGGTFAERMDADRRLAACVRERGGSALLATLMRGGVLVGGAQVLPTSFRWGYGWPYPCAGPSD